MTPDPHWFADVATSALVVGLAVIVPGTAGRFDGLESIERLQSVLPSAAGLSTPTGGPGSSGSKPGS